MLARKWALRLNGQYLAVQGPPGTGKTSTGARMVADLIAQGCVVGITALSHAVIRHLLEAAVAECGRRGIACVAAQKVSSDGQGTTMAGVLVTDSNAKIEEGLEDGRFNLVAGTAYLFARPALEEAIDVLIVDEAGQMTLANTVAAATAARSLVLLGDPQQLAQPVQGTHPPGAAVSALEHVLQGRPTIGDDEGVFLDVSHRLHPDIGRYISAIAYEGRLRSDDACGQQRLGGDDALSGTGLRFIPVPHKDRKTVSPEEVDVVQAVTQALVDRSWTSRDGRTRAILLSDILVVAPYNAHVNRLTRALPIGARVGTVDRFQGQEAPVVIYTLASSSPEDAPRGPEFLYSLNRLNVAVSRAQGLAVLVASPALLDAKPRTVEQLPLIDALCRFAVGATLIDPATLT